MWLLGITSFLSLSWQWISYLLTILFQIKVMAEAKNDLMRRCQRCAKLLESVFIKFVPDVTI